MYRILGTYGVGGRHGDGPRDDAERGGKGSYFPLAVGTNLYVTNNDDDSVTVMDTLTNGPLNVLAPVLTSFTSSSADGTYTTGQSVDVTANFGVGLAPRSKMTVALNTGARVELDRVVGNRLSGTYVAGAGEATPDLNVVSVVSAWVSDRSGDVGTGYGCAAAGAYGGCKREYRRHVECHDQWELCGDSGGGESVPDGGGGAGAVCCERRIGNSVGGADCGRCGAEDDCGGYAAVWRGVRCGQPGDLCNQY